MTLEAGCITVSCRSVVAVCWLVVERCPCSSPASEIPTFEIECPTNCKDKVRNKRVLSQDCSLFVTDSKLQIFSQFLTREYISSSSREADFIHPVGRSITEHSNSGFL